MNLHFLKLFLDLIIVFFFKKNSRVLKDVLKELNWFVKILKIVKITLFWDYCGAFHYFRGFFCFQNLCSWI